VSVCGRNNQRQRRWRAGQAMTLLKNKKHQRQYQPGNGISGSVSIGMATVAGAHPALALMCRASRSRADLGNRYGGASNNNASLAAPQRSDAVMSWHRVSMAGENRSASPCA